MSNGKRGRPQGYRLSENSKRAISEAKKGQHHTQETRDKISKSLKMHFRMKNPLSNELLYKYSNMCEDSYIEDWISDVKYDIDSAEEILTDRSIRNKNKVEYTYGINIEYFSHSMDPELMLLLKEHCLMHDIDPEDLTDGIF